MQPAEDDTGLCQTEADRMPDSAKLGREGGNDGRRAGAKSANPAVSFPPSGPRGVTAHWRLRCIAFHIVGHSMDLHIKSI